MAVPLHPVDRPDVADALETAAATERVDLALLQAVAWTESRYNPGATSSEGARGLMQLLPGTAKALDVENPLDPYQSARGGARFLHQLLDKYNGNVETALAAYNWGPGNVDSGKPWPRATRNYINSILDQLDQTADMQPAWLEQLLARVLRPYPRWTA